MSKSTARPLLGYRGLNRRDFEPFQTDSKDLIVVLLPSASLSPSIAVRADAPRISRHNDDQKGVAEMKYAGLCAIGILVSVGPLAAEQGYAGEGATRCNLGTLYGQYLVAAHGTLFGVAAGIFNVPEGSVSEAAGYSLYNGDGTGTDYVTFTINGVNQNVTSPTPFTYTLKSDCTGMRTVLPSGPSFNIFAAFDGDGLSSIATTPGFAESDYERRTGSR